MVESSETPGAESADDVFSVQYHGYTQTHLDALCHIFHGDYMFNGLSKNKVTNQGASELSVLEMKTGIFTRGGLLDIPRALNLPYLKAEDVIYPEQLDTCLKQANTHLGGGDALVIRTGGWAREQREGRWDVEQGSAGLHASCLPWLKKHDITVLATDLAADLLPSQVTGVRMPIHLVTIAAMACRLLTTATGVAGSPQRPGAALGFSVCRQPIGGARRDRIADQPAGIFLSSPGQT